MIQTLYQRVLNAASSPHAIWILAFISFIESSLFPIPPDVLLIPMVLAAPVLGWRYAFVCTVASVLGGLLGYGLGYFAYDYIGAPILEAMGKADKMDQFQILFAEYGVYTVLVAGITPFPYKVITILSGFAELNLMVFILSSLVARAIRFFLLAGLLIYFGPSIKDFIEKRLGIALVVISIIVIILAFLILGHG